MAYRSLSKQQFVLLSTWCSMEKN